MTRVNLGVLLGLVIGIVDVLLMLPLAFPDKRAALLGAFCSRFALGFFAATVTLPLPAIAAGILVGVHELARRDHHHGVRAHPHHRHRVRRDRRVDRRSLGNVAKLRLKPKSSGAAW